MKMQQIIDKINSEKLDSTELIRMTQEEPRTVKANAIAALAKHYGDDESIIEYLKSYAIDPSHDLVLMGTIKLTHWTVGCIFDIGSSKSKRIVADLLKKWPFPDRNDLVWYLKNNVDGFNLA